MISTAGNTSGDLLVTYGRRRQRRQRRKAKRGSIEDRAQKKALRRMKE